MRTEVNYLSGREREREREAGTGEPSRERRAKRRSGCIAVRWDGSARAGDEERGWWRFRGTLGDGGWSAVRGCSAGPGPGRVPPLRPEFRSAVLSNRTSSDSGSSLLQGRASALWSPSLLSNLDSKLACPFPFVFFSFF